MRFHLHHSCVSLSVEVHLDIDDIMKRIIILLFVLLPLTFLAANDNLFPETLTNETDSMIIDLAVDSIVDTVTVSYPFILDEMPHVVFYHDPAVTNLLRERSVGHEGGQYEAKGFRVQVYASNDSGVARNEALKLYEEMSSKVDVTVHIVSDPPFWKVRLGDFLTREDALQYKQVINQIFPELSGSTYVVPDEVIVNH